MSDLNDQMIAGATEAINAMGARGSWTIQFTEDVGRAAVWGMLSALPKNAVISWPLPAGNVARTAHVSVWALMMAPTRGEERD
jgi:hypothetical protein